MIKNMSESALQNKLVKFLNEKGIYHVKLITTGGAGHPDYIICHRGLFFAIECKAEKGIQSTIQKYRETKIHYSEGIYVLLRPSNFETFKKILA